MWFEDKNGQKEYVWQTSWGFSTRSIGSMIMIHSDNKGLVLPPRVALTQVVLIPIANKKDTSVQIRAKVDEIASKLRECGIRTYCDDRDNYSPGWKYNHWELKGIPIRIELGMKDFEKQEVRVVRRDNGDKFQVKWEALATNIKTLIDKIHNDMYQRALKARDEHLI